MGADVCGDALLRERGGDGPQRGRDDRCATTGETGWSAGRTRFQLTPDSASGDRVEMERCTAVRCRCRCIAGVCQRRRSAAHVRRCVYPRRCRGLLKTRPLARSDSGSGVVAYLRHADSRGVLSPGTLRCAPRTGLWQSAVAPRR